MTLASQLEPTALAAGGPKIDKVPYSEAASISQAYDQGRRAVSPAGSALGAHCGPPCTRSGLWGESVLGLNRRLTVRSV